jgi:hypothetical protein
MNASHTPKATLWIWGHRRVEAHLEVERYPLWAWVARVAAFILAWALGTFLTLILTFDPFIATFPFVVGIGLVHRAFRGRYRVNAFSGTCPRCDNALDLKPGSKISLPHRLDCFRCHFEPELRLG